MSGLRNCVVKANGIGIHVVEQGKGPAVLLCHGFPESWYSWRHQIRALAKAGYRVIAPDMRGFGQTDSPREIDQYTLLHLVGDVVGVLDALGIAKATIVGHDLGALVAWQAALMRPERFPGVVAMSVPHVPRSKVPPTTQYPRTDDTVFYILHYQEPGVAEAEMEHDVRGYLRAMLCMLSGDAPMRLNPDGTLPKAGMVPKKGGLAGRLPAQPPALPAWLTEADVDYYADQFALSGFRGGLNWYRNIDRNNELLAAYDGCKISVPALFMAGERDSVLRFDFIADALATMPQRVPLLRDSLVLPGCGHWTQQERPDEVNAALLKFLRGS
jgi:pimeloyl-ACP methyl ester carboxylesterase